MPPRACSSPLVSCRRPSSHRFRTVVLRAVDFALSPFVLLISYRWLRDAARDVCAVSLPNAFLGVSVLDFHSRIAGLAGFSVCASLISGLTCDLGRQVSSELAFSVSWPVCATPISGPIPDLCRRKIRLMQTRNRGCADPNQPRCSGNSCVGSCAGRLADNCARRLCGRRQLRRSTVRTPKWDPHQERPESVRITRITLSATISETTTILIANFTGPST